MPACFSSLDGALEASIDSIDFDVAIIHRDMDFISGNDRTLRSTANRSLKRSVGFVEFDTPTLNLHYIAVRHTGSPFAPVLDIQIRRGHFLQEKMVAGLLSWTPTPPFYFLFYSS